MRYQRHARILFDEIIFKDKFLNGENSYFILIPAKSQFKASVAEEILRLQGPRRLISLLNRAQKGRFWVSRGVFTAAYKTETDNVSGVTTLTGDRAHHYRILRKMKKAGMKFLGDEGSPLEKFQTLLPDSFETKTDSELEQIARDWIKEERTRQLAPNSVPDEYLEAYERSFYPPKDPDLAWERSKKWARPWL